jgi:hypothetical protein
MSMQIVVLSEKEGRMKTQNDGDDHETCKVSAGYYLMFGYLFWHCFDIVL